MNKHAKIKVKCLYCKKEFYVNKSRFNEGKVKYCSKKCKGKHDFKLHKNNWISKKHNKNNNCKCKNCKKEFYVKPYAIKSGRGIFCCKKCQFIYKSKINNIDCICENCYKIFTTTISIFISGRARHCCKKCSYNNRKEEMKNVNKARISQITVECLNCKNKFSVIKSRYKKGNVKFCSLNCRIEYCVGDKSHTWKGGLTNINLLERGNKKYDNWRLKVFKRDNFTCKKCLDNKGHNLHAHHIYNFSSNKTKRYDINNGITLCKKCHKEFHKKYGFKNNNIKQLEEYLKNKNIKELKK